MKKSLIAAFTVATLAVGAGAQSFQTPLSSQNRLIASTPTKKKLGWMAEKLPDWSETNVVVLTKADLLSGLDKTKLTGTDADDNLYEAALKQHLSSLGIKDEETPLGNKMLLAEFVRESFEHDAFQSFTIKRKDASFCLMTISSTDMAPAAHASLLSRIPADKISNVPGTPSEWFSLFVAHEAAHCAQAVKPRTRLAELVPIIEEVGADQFTLKTYFQALSTGNVRTADLPKTFLDLRTLGLVFGDFDHGTSVFIDLGKLDTPISEDEILPREAAGRHAVFDLIYRHVAEKTHIPIEIANLAMTDTPGLFSDSLKTLYGNGAFAHDPDAQKFAVQVINSLKMAPDFFSLGNLPETLRKYRP